MTSKKAGEAVTEEAAARSLACAAATAALSNTVLIAQLDERCVIIMHILILQPLVPSFAADSEYPLTCLHINCAMARHLHQTQL